MLLPLYKCLLLYWCVQNSKAFNHAPILLLCQPHWTIILLYSW